MKRYWVLLIFGWCLELGAQMAVDLRHLEVDREQMVATMSWDGKQLWQYHGMTNKPYFHPLNLPGTTEALTLSRPADHPWHLGLWFSWKFIDRYNFWEPHDDALTRVMTQQLIVHDDQQLEIKLELAYLGKGLELVREKRSIIVITARDGTYQIKWDSRFRAPQKEVTLKSSPAKRDAGGAWSAGGYAGLTWRLADSRDFEYQITNQQGDLNVKSCGELSESLQIQATSKHSGRRAVLTWRETMGGADKPTAWFVRHNLKANRGAGYFVAGPAPVFHNPLTLKPLDELHLGYELHIDVAK